MGDPEVRSQVFLNAVIFLRRLVQEGLPHVVISPGSRSTPLTLAASALPQLKKNVVLDERSAAFLALGIAKATGKPAALICTSGTAVANYLPAVIEASKSGIPMLLLTADRPARLHGTGANQTINQKDIFKNFAALFEQMNEPFEKYSEQDLAERAKYYFQQSITKHGPVHINFPFDKPLEPEPEIFKAVSDENKKLTSPVIKADKRPFFSLDEPLLAALRESERPLIIAGQITPAANSEAIFQLAEQLNAPVLTEQGIADTDVAIQGYDGSLRSTINQKMVAPDLILRFGLQPASKSLLESIKNWSPKKHIYFGEGGIRSDIENAVTDFIEWNGRFFDADSINQKDDGWLQLWRDIEREFANTREQKLLNCSKLTDGHIYHQLSPQIPDNWFVFIANSFPARDQSLFAQWKAQKLFTNRGASGIDGITSTAMGVNIGLQQSGILFTGDLSFLHDTNALLNQNELDQPLVIVVINNRGGQLFQMLPVVEYEEQFTAYFETPQSADIAKLAASYQINTTVINTIEGLKQIDLKQIANQTNSNIHIVECRTDPDRSMNIRNQLWSFEYEG